MRLLIPILIPALLSAQTITMSAGPIRAYNDQFSGANSWPNNGRYFDGDSMIPTLCSDNVTYTIIADGLGPNASLVGGRNIFIISVSDYVSPAGGALLTVRNSLDDYGTITQTNTNGWTDDSDWKPGGLLCLTVAGVERMILSVYRQAFPVISGANGSLVWSGDRGATWCSSSHTNHTTGACTITPLAIGDAPTNGQQMFEAMGIRTLKFMQYGKSGFIQGVVDRNDEFVYAFGEGATLADLYLYRISASNLFKMDQTLFAAYKGGTCSADGSWDTTHPFTSRVGITGLSGLSNLVGQPIYLPTARLYIIPLIDSSGNNVFLSAKTICGPFTQILSIPSDPAIVQAWFYPTLKSMTISNGTINIVFGSGAGTQHRTEDPTTNKYSYYFMDETFTPSVNTSYTGRVKLEGRTQ